MQVWRPFRSLKVNHLHWSVVMKSWLLRGLALLVLAWLSFDVFFSDHGYRVYLQEQQQLELLQAELTSLKAQREILAKEILRLRHDPKALEDLIHRDLGYVYPDEYILIMPDKKQVKESK